MQKSAQLFISIKILALINKEKISLWQYKTDATVKE